MNSNRTKPLLYAFIGSIFYITLLFLLQILVSFIPNTLPLKYKEVALVIYFIFCILVYSWIWWFFINIKTLNSKFTKFEKSFFLALFVIIELALISIIPRIFYSPITFKLIAMNVFNINSVIPVLVSAFYPFLFNKYKN
jgi:hypothetical protein